MTISATIIEDSIGRHHPRLVTVQLRYPRFIHAELMTHRVFSRNASSSRAIPVPRLIDDVLNDTAMPLSWGANQPGMQAGVELNATVEVDDVSAGLTAIRSKEDAWRDARDHAVAMALSFHKAGYAKQIVNRLLEPFSHINVVVSSTYWANFFALRDHPAAQPEIRILAQAIKRAMADSIPNLLASGMWHLPYLSAEEHPAAGPASRQQWEQARKISAARCARVSYLTHDQKPPSAEDDLKLFERLVSVDSVVHASPMEHQATPDIKAGNEFLWPGLHGNFYGWVQHRHLLSGNTVHD